MFCVTVSGRLHTCLDMPMSPMVYKWLKVFSSPMQQWRAASRQMWSISTSAQSDSSVLMIHSRSTQLKLTPSVSSC